ncbi:hypothetical protein, partial [Longispora fulva]|uniref:hypothetical protein n=2 Tax=Bacteria TaxID=2 RepID=UPI003645410E
YGGQVPYIPPPAFERNWKELSAGSIKKLLKKSYKLHKKAMRDYRTALSQINDGSCREIFIRHKARFENMLFELKSLKTLLSFRKENWRRQEQET